LPHRYNLKTPWRDSNPDPLFPRKLRDAHQLRQLSGFPDLAGFRADLAQAVEQRVLERPVGVDLNLILFAVQTV
jgi:hypothetical protein